MHIHKLCGWEGCVYWCICQCGCGGRSLKIAQEVLKFKILLTSLGLGGWGCSCKWKWKPFSSNSSEWVSWTRFHSQNLELLNRRKCWSGLKQFEQLLLDTGFKMDHWRLFPPKNLHLRFVCFVFIFIRGPHRKGLLNSFLCKLPLCSCKVLFLSLCCKLHFH